MSTEENKEVVRRFFEAGMNQRNVGIADELFGPAFVSHFGGLPEPVRGREHWKQLAAGYFTAFPDFQITLEDLIAEGDKVVARWAWRATHQGEFMGIPPTSTQVAVSGMGVYRIAEGKIAEEWVQDDVLGLLQQLGAIPAPGPATS